ncbi:scavenger receptor cysteine-rich type 1 protein M130-like isoform X11 [Astyanax mexicanus]|uniref:scavenger receptor cysteine-rich type 1 protein M130-like isoform X11 n=1 Tax=Astyanax mexicanus TaxID=7994 RepID=UPI0020CB0422|nr:scavenger receptor cysteine-rich type 1 protein M130-like isoform X11 [Astyanax mexicanus]
MMWDWCVQESCWLMALATLEEWRFFMVRAGSQCVMLTLTSRMQRLCVGSWAVVLLWRFWEQLLLVEGRVRCGQRSFSVEEMNHRFTSVQNHLHSNTTAPMIMMWDWCVLESGWLVVLTVLGEWRFFMERAGPQCVMLTLTSRVQRLCVESWAVVLLWRFWEQLLLVEGRVRCGQRSFSVEETNLRFTSVQNHLNSNTTAPMMMMWDWHVLDAEVVCSWELGCGSPVEVLGAAAFGRAEGQMWSEELQCRGNESHMYLCQTSPSLKPNCSHNKDVGLRCSGHTQARLMNGSDSCSGRVELQYLSEWGTVCDVSWDMRAASVLCAQLKCGSSVAVLGSDWFGEGSGRIWADVFDCQGNETHLLKCPISSWSRTACSHEQYAGVICSGSSLASHEGGVRLSGGMECEGEVEVFFRQDWRRVLLDSWSESEASVVCRQLGCGSVLNISSSSSSSPEHSYMCVTGFNCSGSEAHLRNCSSSQAVNCSSTVQLYITCSGTSNTVHSSIRLVGSGGDCAGRLEVFHSGSWGTVSDELWDIEDAQVVCRQLQCGVALSAPVPVPARFGSGTGPIWLNEVECEGNEVSLWNCRYQLCGEDECGHKDDVGVVCSEYKEIRLTEGCEGNLEVYYNGTWGNVCVNGMTDETAKLICRELNYGRTGSESWSKARVESAPNWLDNVKCRKHDSTLWHCPSSSWGENRCDNRNEVACITCSENGNTLDLTNWLCDSSPHERPCSKHIPLRLRGGVGSCSGWLQVYHNKTWGSVCGDLWDIRDAQVICRQLGCGPALSANRRAADGSGGGTIWMNRVKCRGNEIHLWDCPHSLKNHTDCSHSAGVTCGGFLYHTLPLNNKRGQMGHFVLQDSQPQTRRIILPQTPPPAVPSIYPVSLLVLGYVLFLALVLLVVLFYQNRVLRRVISKRRKTSAEPVYVEIDTRLIPKRITVSTESKSKMFFFSLKAEMSGLYRNNVAVNQILVR